MCAFLYCCVVFLSLLPHSRCVTPSLRVCALVLRAMAPNAVLSLWVNVPRQWRIPLEWHQLIHLLSPMQQLQLLSLLSPSSPSPHRCIVGIVASRGYISNIFFAPWCGTSMIRTCMHTSGTCSPGDLKDGTLVHGKLCTLVLCWKPDDSLFHFSSRKYNRMLPYICCIEASIDTPCKLCVISVVSRSAIRAS